jgi:hypothetical protein
MNKYSLIALVLVATLLAGALVAMPLVEEVDAAKKKIKQKIVQRNSGCSGSCSNSAANFASIS